MLYVACLVQRPSSNLHYGKNFSGQQWILLWRYIDFTPPYASPKWRCLHQHFQASRHGTRWRSWFFSRPRPYRSSLLRFFHFIVIPNMGVFVLTQPCVPLVFFPSCLLISRPPRYISSNSTSPLSAKEPSYAKKCTHLMDNEPCGLLCDVQVVEQLVWRYAFLVAADQVHCNKPFDEAHLGVFEYGSH